MPSIFKLANLELPELKTQKTDLLSELGLDNTDAIGGELDKVRKQMKDQKPAEEEVQTFVGKLEDLKKRENNLLFLQKIEEGIVNIESSQTSQDNNSFFSIVDVEDDPIKTVSFHLPGGKSKTYSRGELKTTDNQNFSDKQILRIPNPSVADITVEFTNGGTFTRHANGDLSITAPKDKGFDRQELYSFTDQILLDYAQKKSGDAKTPISLDFDSIPDSSKDEWKKRTLSNIIYKYTREGESHGAQDRYNEIISALIAGGSMTPGDMNRYSIKLNQAYSYDLKGFDEYRKVVNEDRISKVTADFLKNNDKADVDSENVRTLKKVGATALNLTASGFKSFVNLGLNVLGSGSRISEAALMVNRKELDHVMLDNFKALFRDIQNKPADSVENVKTQWGKIPAYKRLKASGVSDSVLFDIMKEKLTQKKPEETSAQTSAPNPGGR